MELIDWILVLLIGIFVVLNLVYGYFSLSAASFIKPRKFWMILMPFWLLDQENFDELGKRYARKAIWLWYIIFMYMIFLFGVIQLLD